MTKTQHLINAILRAQEQDMMIVNNGAPGSNDYIVIREGKAYNVSVLNGKITCCTCPHNVFRNVVCKHMMKVAMEKNLEISMLSQDDIELDVV